MSKERDEYYSKIFMINTPHEQELIRWEAIEETALNDYLQYGNPVEMKALDVGCGRAWLTKLLNERIPATGLDPVPDVIENNKNYFPDLSFICDELEHYSDTTEDKYDVVVCSEVIEHVERDKHLDFIKKLYKLLKTRGLLIMTSPVGEASELWFTLHPGGQPVEDWLTTIEFQEKARQAGLSDMYYKLLYSYAWNGNDVKDPTQRELKSRVVIPLYQIWGFIKY